MAVFINGKQYVSDNVSLIVYLPNGTYNPIFVIPNGYTENDIGMFTVNGNTSYFIQLSQSPFIFLQNNLAYIIVFCVKNSICSLYPINKNNNPDNE